jgi:Flp pilus assembly protein TadG
MRLIKRSQKRRGAAAVEAAIVLPVFFTFIFGMMEMSQMGMTAQLITDAALEGCRVAVLDGKTQSDVDATVQAILNSGGVTTYTPPAITPSFQSTPLGQPITVTISVNFSDVSWLPNPKYLGSATIGASSTLSSERINIP